MAKFWTHDGEYVTSIGSCADGSEQLHAPQGHTLVLGEPPMQIEDRPDITARWNLARSRWEVWSPPASEQYMFDRRKSYPDLGDQMDAFWHAMNTGLLPRVEPFYSNIRAVKDQFPKP